MENSVWDSYWEKESKISLNKIIENDNYYKLLKRLMGSLNNCCEIKLLEAGCGTGSRSVALIKDFSYINWEVTLLDSSDKALTFAKRLAIENGLMARITLVKGDVLEMPFPDRYFDIVWNEGVNEHFAGRERQRVFEEMVRVTKNGGRTIVVVPNALNLPYRVRKRILELRGAWEYGFEKPFTFWELKNIMEKLNLYKIKMGADKIFVALPDFLKSIFAFSKRKDKFQTIRYAPTAGGRVIKPVKMMIKLIISISRIADVVLVPVFGRLMGSNIGISGVKENDCEG